MKKNSTQTCPCQSKSKDENSWICCSLCKQWWHSSCAAISAKDIKKYTAHSIYYICLYCNIQNIKNNKTLVENIINLLKTNTEVSNSPDSENPNPVTAEESPGPTKRQKLPELHLIDFDNNNTSHCKYITKKTAPINNINKEKLEVTEERNQPNKINKTHTVILDNISSNLQNPKDIKKHIYKILDSNIKIRYTYCLPKGGLIIDTQSQRDIEIISEKSQQIFPGCILNQPRNNQSITVVKNINPRIASEDIEEEIQSYYKVNCEVMRYHSNITKHPFPVISIKTVIQTEAFLKEGIHIFDKHHPCEVYKPPIIRCFNCQEFGHIALQCNSKSNCVNCAYPSHDGPCHNPPHCTPMKILQLNITSINNSIKALEFYLEQNNYDMITLQETDTQEKLESQITDRYKR